MVGLVCCAIALTACGPPERDGPSGGAPPASSTAAGKSASAAAPSPSAAPTDTIPAAALPLFDAHLHYNEEAWPVYPPETVLALLARAGVKRALVSSTPDAGTFRLYDRAPELIVPFLRPYRSGSGAAGWARDGTTVAYVRSIYRPGVHRGIGEIHLAAGESALPVVSTLIDMAVSEKLWLQIHTDARGIGEVMQGPASRTRVLWAHAGQTATPAEIAALVERYPTLWVELSGRTDIAPSGAIDPAWRDLLTPYSERFLVGSDTWINPQWERLEQIEAGLRSWLSQLPSDIARRIAVENAAALFPPPG